MVAIEQRSLLFSYLINSVMYVYMCAVAVDGTTSIDIVGALTTAVEVPGSTQSCVATFTLSNKASQKATFGTPELLQFL